MRLTRQALHINASQPRLALAIHGIGADKIATALATFKGAKRRFEYRDTLACGAELYDDYAHHPVEIRASIDAALKVADGRLGIVYRASHLLADSSGFSMNFARRLRRFAPGRQGDICRYLCRARGKHMGSVLRSA